MSSYYIGSNQERTYYISHHGIKGQKWGVRRYQNKDGSLTSTGRARTKSYSWIKDKLGYDERDKRDVAYAKATYEGFKADAALKAKKEAYERASKPIDYSLETARNLHRSHEGLKGHTFKKGFDLGIKEQNAWNNYNVNPTQRNLDAALAVSNLIASELEEEEFFKELLKNGQQYLSTASERKKQELDAYLAASNRYATATTNQQRAVEELRSANNAYNKTILGRIESAKAKISKGTAFVKGLFKRKK